MALPAGLTWEVRTTGNANNGGAYINLIPGTSVDYSQQNASQLSITDGACLLASVTLTSVIGGFTAGMVGNVIQIRAGGVNFVAGFYEIVLINSANSVNLDRTPVAAGNGTGGLGEVGGALISPAAFLSNCVTGNFCYVKSGTYNFAGSVTSAAGTTTMFGYDASRSIAPTLNNRPLFQLGAFIVTTALADNFTLRNIRWTGSGAQLINFRNNGNAVINCKFENTANVGTTRCIYHSVNGFAGVTILDCEFSGTPGADSRGIETITQGIYGGGFMVAFNFFHDLTYGYYNILEDGYCCFIKNIFARIGAVSIAIGGAVNQYVGTHFFFNSFYSAGSYHIQQQGHVYALIYGNTFDSAVVAAIRESVLNNLFHIENNDFWNNGASVVNCVLDYDNIGLNPLWVNPGANDFNFGPGSPNIDQTLGIRLGV